MNDNLSNALAALAAKLGVAVPMLWQALRKQAYLDSIFYSVIGGCLLGLLLLTAIIAIYSIIEGKSEGSLVVCFLAILVCLIYFAIIGSDTLSGFCNPDYAALKIASQLLGGK